MSDRTKDALNFAGAGMLMGYGLAEIARWFLS